MLHLNATQSPTPIKIRGVAFRSTSAIERLSDTAPSTITLMRSAALNPLSCNRRALRASARSTAAIGASTAKATWPRRRRPGPLEERIGMSLKTLPIPGELSTTFSGSHCQSANLARNDLGSDRVDVLAHALRHCPLRLVVVGEFDHIGVPQSEDDVGGWDGGAVLYPSDDSDNAVRVVGEVGPQDVVGRG